MQEPVLIMFPAPPGVFATFLGFLGVYISYAVAKVLLSFLSSGS